MDNQFTYNEHTDFYEALYDGHSIYVSDDTLMLQLQQLQASGLSEREAMDELFSVGWWIEHTPLSGLFIDGVEQVDEAEYSLRAKDNESNWDFLSS